MAASALEEKINKIRQQNEEIRRRHEEVEEDKKNAAKLNALVQMVPSTDWPERKEPPEFSNPPTANSRPKLSKDHHMHSQQYHLASGEGRKVHIFAQGQGPPPDPKYNFLADSEREEGNIENTRDNPPNRVQKPSRGGIFKKKHGGKDGVQKVREDYRINKGSHRDERQPEYEAWRAERNRIDEDRISRQRTAEGNWRREWDNDKAHVGDMSKPELKLGNYIKKDHKYHNGNDYGHNRGGNHRSYRGNSRHFRNNYENRSNNAYYQNGHVKSSVSLGSEERTVTATDKSIKITLNQGKGPLMSVKVNTPSIAGTGRVGPRQRSRITYSTHSDVEIDSFSHPKSFEDKNKSIYHDNFQRSSNIRKSQPVPRRKDLGNKSPYFHKKEIRKENVKDNVQKYHETELIASYAQEEYKKSQESCQSKPQRENDVEILQNDEIVIYTKEEINAVVFKLDTKDTESKDRDNDDLNTNLNVNEIHEKTGESVFQNTDLSMFETETEIEIHDVATIENKSDKADIFQVIAVSECKAPKTDLITPLVKDADNNDKNETKSSVSTLYDTKEIIKENKKKQNLSAKQINEIISDNSDSKQDRDESEQKEDVKHNTKDVLSEKQTNNIIISSSTDACSMKVNNKLESNDKVLKEEEILVAEDIITALNEKIDTEDKRDIMTRTEEIQDRISDNNYDENDEKSNPAQITL